jgi:hypothetical protein
LKLTSLQTGIQQLEATRIASSVVKALVGLAAQLWALGGSTNRAMTTIGKVGETGQLRASRWALQVALERPL